jgi:hypothetical protein
MCDSPLRSALAAAVGGACGGGPGLLGGPRVVETGALAGVADLAVGVARGGPAVEPLVAAVTSS